MSEKEKWAIKEFNEARRRATYISLAQKLAQHLNNLAEDKNTRIRWIWELIQNAKDASNQTSKCKIRIEIHENKFIFAHNGNPFKVQNLYSIVAQYSSKSEQNTTDYQTTGKYGTGFITTYILSRKVRIKGLLEKQKEPNLKEEVQQQKPLTNNSECQIFEVFLDRQYKDRDQQFYYKLMKTQNDLIEQLKINDPQPKWQLRQDEFNTQFAYQQLDEAAFKMIDESMDYIKQLFPYALLFNPKLLQIKMIDKRKDKKLRNFGIKRIKQTKISNLPIFNAQIVQQGKESIFSLAYLQDKDTYSVVAMPLKKQKKTITILELNHKMPKMFKEFPLIGCKDTGFNFVFTSQHFYPSQTRSDLLLKEIQSRNSKKSYSNWESLDKIFKTAKLLYTTLAQIATQGIQNLLILTLQNQFSSEQFKNKNFKNVYSSFREQISNIKCISFKNKSRGLIREILCPFGKSVNTTIQQDQYSKKMNSVFSLLLGQDRVLNDDQYQRFYPKLIQHQKTWQGLIQFKQLKECLKCLHTLKFEGLIVKAGSEQNALNVLENIYQLLQQHNSEFLTQEKFKLLKNEQQINYVLTNNLQLKDLRCYSCRLMKKTNVPDAYCEVADQLDIDIDQNLIFDRFTKFFEKTPQFTIETILKRFHNFFFNYQSNGEEYLPKLIQLGRFLTTFNISSKIFDVASKVRNLSDMCTPYELDDSQSKLYMSKQMANDFRVQLQYGTLLYINDQISEKTSLAKMINLLTITDNNKYQAIIWLNNVYKIQKTLMHYKSKIFEKIRKQKYQKFGDVLDPSLIIQYGLAKNENFYFIKKLKIFNNTPSEKYPQYPDDYDLDFYSKMRQVYNNKKKKIGLGHAFFLPVFDETILHSQIRYKSTINTTFKEEFLFTIDLYNQLQGENKIFYINYLHNCEKKAKQDPKLKFKTEMFKQIIKNMYYDYPKQIKCLEKSEDQQFMYHLYNHVEDIAYAKQIHEIIGLRQGLQKLKSEITNENKEKTRQSSDNSLLK